MRDNTVGTFVVINDEGWIATAAHILQVLNDLSVQEQQTRERKAQIAAVEADKTLNGKERRRKLAQVGHLDPDSVENWSVWWGVDGAALVDPLAYAIEVVDIAVVRLDHLIRPELEYPVFKRSEVEANEHPVGVSVCRMGFPFWDVEPTWDESTRQFNLTRNFPLPVFVNEGIISRNFINVPVDPQGNLVDLPFRLRCIETSNAGLPGQSGGPIFDNKATVWGIQTATRSYPLDLQTEGKQYYNVGIGCHAEALTGLLQANNIKHKVSDY